MESGSENPSPFLLSNDDIRNHMMLDSALFIQPMFHTRKKKASSIVNLTNLTTKKLVERGRSKLIISNHSDNDIQTDETNEGELYCSNHEHKGITAMLHCSDCKKNLCINCMKKHHLDNKKHEYLDFKELSRFINEEAKGFIEELDGKENNLQPKFNLDEIQKKGLEIIEQSKEEVINFIEEFFKELSENFSSLTSKYLLASQKKYFMEKLNELRDSLKKFSDENFSLGLINEYLKKDYKGEVDSLQRSINNFINKIDQEDNLPKIQKNENVLEKIKYDLLDFIQIEVSSKKNINEISLTEQSDQNQSIKSFFENKIKINDYYVTQKKYLHYLFPEEQKLLLYDIDTNNNLIMSLNSEVDELPLYSTTLFTPELDFFIIGGKINGKVTKKVFKYDKTNKNLIEAKSMLIERMAFGLCYVKGDIYCFGGVNSENKRINFCERYTIKNNKWEPIDKMKQELASPGVCVLNDNEIYVFFGTTTEKKLSTLIEKYDIKKKKWNEIKVSNWIDGLEMSQISCCTINKDQIILFGGTKKIRNLNYQTKNIDEKYLLSNRILLFNTNDLSLTNLGENLPEGQLSMGQLICYKNNIYSIRAVNKIIGDDNAQFSTIFSILKIDENLKSSLIDIINWNDVKRICGLKRKKKKFD